MLVRTVSGRTYSYSHCLGRGANGGTGFRYAMDVGLAPGGVAYVLNRTAEYNPFTRVTKCTLGDGAGQEEFLLEFGSYGSEDGQFMQVTCLALDSEENVYVADEWLNRISVFDRQGRFLNKWGVAGPGEGELNRPWELAFDRDENLWVVDSGNERVQAFSREGRFLRCWGREGSGDGEFNMPWGITVDGAGDVYVADWHNGRVQKFDQEGRYLMSFGASGSGDGELRRPSGVAVDEQGDVYVADWGASQVHAYRPDGSYITTFIGDAQRLPAWGEMSIAANPDMGRARMRVKSLEPEWRLLCPTAVKVDDRRRIVVVDQQRSRLQIYVKEKDYVEPQFNL